MIKLFLTIFLFVSYYSVSPIYAQDASPSAKPQLESTNSAVNIKLEDLKKEIASKAAVLKAEIDKKIGNKAYVGKVAGVSIDTITVQSDSRSRSVKVDEYTIFQDQSTPKSKKALTLELLKNDDSIIALGEVDENLMMTAKKIIKTDPQKTSPLAYIVGQISKVETSKLTLKMRSGVEQVIDFAPTTSIKNDKSTGSIVDLKLTRNIIAVMPSKEATQSSFIYILPTGGIKTLGESTQSATPAATKKP